MRKFIKYFYIEKIYSRFSCVIVSISTSYLVNGMWGKAVAIIVFGSLFQVLISNLVCNND